MNEFEGKKQYSLPINQFNTLMNLLILRVSKKSFNILHINVDGYECHSDGLREILSKTSINFDIVLSETSQQSDHVFSKNGTVIKMPLMSPSSL